jgi:hypothetical protein
MGARVGYRFAAIPEWVLYHHALDPVDIRVFGVLSRLAVIHPVVDPSLAEIGAKIGVVKSTVHRAIGRLTSVGAVIAEHRRDDAGRDLRSLYRLAGDTPLRGSTSENPTDQPKRGETAGQPGLQQQNPHCSLREEIPPGGAGEPTPPQEPSRQELVALYVDQARLNGYDPTGKVKGHVASQLKRLLEKDHKPIPVLRMALIAVAKEGKPIGDLDYVVADAERSLNGHGKEASNGQIRRDHHRR